MQETVEKTGDGCGCGDKHGKTWVTPFIVGVIVTLAAMLVFGYLGHIQSNLLDAKLAAKMAVKPEAKVDLSVGADVAELRLKMTNIVMAEEALRKEVAEIKNVLVSTIQKEQQIESSHNNLVKELQGIISQNNRALMTLDRTFRDKFGKDKWMSMVKTADTDLAQEAADAIKEQMKAKENAEKAGVAKPVPVKESVKPVQGSAREP